MCLARIDTMYLRSAVAAVFVVAVSGQLCGFRSNEQCLEDLEVCRANVTRKLSAGLMKIPELFARDAMRKTQDRVHDLFTDPFHAFQHAFEEDSENLRSGVEASAAVTKILSGSVKPLLQLVSPSESAGSNAVGIPIKIILQTMILLKNFTDDKALRNNSQVEKILNIFIPLIQTVNDDGVRCGAAAVGGLLQFPLRAVAFIIGKILDYMMECYSLREEPTFSCEFQSALVEFTLSACIFVLQFLLDIIQN